MRMNLLSIVAACLVAPSAVAGDHSLSLTPYLATDYMFRGLSQTDNEPALQLGIDYTHSSGFYAGAFFSNVDFGTDTNREQSVFVGYGNNLTDDLAFDLQAWRYGYHRESEANYSEYSVGLTYKWVTARYWWTDNYYNLDINQDYYELNLDIPLNDDFTLGLHAGHTDTDVNIFDYSDYSISLSTNYKGFDMTLMATDTNGEALAGNTADSRLVFTVSRSFELLD